MKYLALVTLFFVACASAPHPVASAPVDPAAECLPNTKIARAREEIDALDYESAAMTLQRALEGPRNCREDVAEIFRLKGVIDAING
jgi:Tfp pilus assembly protein PilF